MTDTNDFKNFHRALCARFGYTHDEKDWRRDLVSLEEHIAALAAPKPDESELDGTVAAHPAWWRGFQAGVYGTKAQSAQDVMVNMTPPATSRDRWMYEQGRLAERDPRTHAIESKAAPEPQPKGLFVDMIAEHPGLAEEMAQPVQSPPLKSFKELEYKVGWQRYEKVRRLNVQQFSDLFQRGLKGERFDDMVDEIGAKP